LLRHETNGLITYTFASLTTEGLVHAVFTRLGGASNGSFATLNVGHTVGDDEAAVAENHARIYAHLGLDAHQVVTARQVHGNRVAVAIAGDGGRVFANTDGLTTDVPGMALMLRFADCQPILLYDPVGHAVGLVHAGWRGIAQGVAYRAVETMQKAFGSQPRDLIAGLGPAIGPGCYTVGHDVASAMGYALPDWAKVMRPEGEDLWRFDLSGANAQQLANAGVRHIEQANLCTACHSEEFFSHRVAQGQTGRFAVVAYLTARPEDERARMTPPPPGETTPEETGEPYSLHPPGFPPFGDDPGRSQ
jgi:YfiH family protein